MRCWPFWECVTGCVDEQNGNSATLRLKIATYNIHRAVGADGRQDAARIARVLRELDADVVALQEVAYRAEEPGHLLDYLAEELQARAIEGVTMHDDRGHYGNAVLTRLPVFALNRLDISFPRREPRGAIELGVHALGIEIQIIATHLGLRPRERRHQIKSLLTRFDSATADVKVLLGDLNEWFLWGRPVRWLHRVFGDVGAPATFPARRPLLALDRLWVHPLSVVDEIRVHATATSRIASDHLPVVAELSLKGFGAAAAR